MAALTGAPKEVVAIDGKTLRRSGEKKSAKAAIHMVSAFAARQRLVLGQVKVADKANEIVAIPKLLDLLAIEGAIVTLDAIGCQRAIAQQILDKKADYVLALKGNQGTLREDVELFAAEQKANGFKDAKISRHQTVDGDHGRIETRTYTAIHDVAWLQERHGWPGLQGVIMVESTREIADKIERETRFYITSLVWLASQLGPVIRSHWAIENSLHWVMDMIFRDDECRIRTDHAPANFTTIKHMAQNLIRKAPGKDSLRLRRKTAAWDDDFLASLLAHDSFTRFPCLLIPAIHCPANANSLQAVQRSDAKTHVRDFATGMPLDAATTAIGDLVLGERGKEAGGRPAFLVGLLGELRPHRFDGGQAQVGEHELDARGVDRIGLLHAAPPSSTSSAVGARTAANSS